MKSYSVAIKLSSTLILLLCTLFLYSQQKDGKSYFHITIGPSFPLGKYGNGEDYTTNQGMAKTGGVIKLSATTLVKKNFGLIASLQFQVNPINTAALEKDIWKVSNGQLGVGGVFTDTVIVFPSQPPPRTSPYKNWQVDNSLWKVGSLMVGAFNEFPFKGSKNLSLFVEGNIGFTYAWSPEITGQSATDTSFATFKQYKNSGMGFSYSLGSGLNYGLNTKTNLRFNINYFGTSTIRFANLRTVGYTEKGNNPMGGTSYSSMVRDGKIPISSINIGVGFSFLL